MITVIYGFGKLIEIIISNTAIKIGLWYIIRDYHGLWYTTASV